MSKQGKKIEDIDQLLAMAGSNLSILEEEVDIKVQKEYFEMVNLLSKRTENYQKTSKQYLENINDLYDDTIDPEIKKKMLVVLATLDDVSVYRAIENFSKQDTPLKKWAIIALQQSRMLLQSTLLDDPGVFISTGLGGQGLLLRYFCVFFYRVPGDLPSFQQNTLKNEAETATSGPDIETPSAILMEAATGQVIYEKDSSKQLAPASITKIMTLILIFEALESGQIKMEDPVTVSEYAASMGGSQVFLEEGEIQSVRTMIKCIAVASANDACVAL